MIRATVHFADDDGTTGWLCDFSEMPREGEEIRLHDGAGRTTHAGHVAMITRRLYQHVPYRAGAETIEVYVAPPRRVGALTSDPERHWLIRYEDADARDEVFTDEDAARARSDQIAPSWNHVLFVEVERR